LGNIRIRPFILTGPARDYPAGRSQIPAELCSYRDAERANEIRSEDEGGSVMARARRSLDERIEEQKQVVSKAREHYEAEVNKLEQMMNKRDELQKKELMKAVEDSSRSFEEIMQFLQGDASSENSEDVES
jgi:Lon protease-like protein